MAILEVELKSGQKAHIECSTFTIRNHQIKLKGITKYVATYPDGRPAKEIPFKPSDEFQIDWHQNYVKTVKIVSATQGGFLST